LRYGVTIRAAAAGDIEGVLRVERGSEDAPHWDEARYREMVESDRLHVLRRVLFVAVERERVVGFAVGTVLLEDAELESLVVEEAWRRSGVGSGLSEALLAWAQGQEAMQMRLEVRAENVAARTLYQRLGFQECGLRRGYYVDPVDDAVLMVKGLR